MVTSYLCTYTCICTCIYSGCMYMYIYMYMYVHQSVGECTCIMSACVCTHVVTWTLAGSHEVSQCAHYLLQQTMALYQHTTLYNVCGCVLYVYSMYIHVHHVLYMYMYIQYVFVVVARTFQLCFLTSSLLPGKAQ